MAEEKGRRFRVIEGAPQEPAQKRAPRRRDPAAERIHAYRCTECSDALGYDVSALVQVRLHGVEQGGRLIGGEDWWACARCQRPKFFIRKAR